MTLTRSWIRNAVTTPLDARLMDMAQIVANADGTPRTGVLGPIASNLVVATANASPMTVNVLAGEFVCSRGKSDGVTIFTNDGSVSVTIAAAPASNSRIDVVWVRHNDNTQGDANSDPVFGVTAGTAAASPTPAAIPTGATELAQVRIYAGTTATNGGSNTVTQTYQMTAGRGGIVVFRTLADLTAWTTAAPGQVATIQGDPRTLYRRDAATWRTVTDDLGFVSVTTPVQTGITAETAVTGALLTVTVPRAGPIEISGQVATSSTAVTDLLVVRIKEGATVIADFVRTANSSPSTPNTSTAQTFSVIIPNVTEGAHTYRMFLQRVAGPGAVATAVGAATPTQLAARLRG
jgi:hypothetical protein